MGTLVAARYRTTNPTSAASNNDLVISAPACHKPLAMSRPTQAQLGGRHGERR